MAAPTMLQANLAVVVISRSNFPTFVQFDRDLAVSVVRMLRASFNRVRMRRSIEIGAASLGGRKSILEEQRSRLILY
jgi:hypothetical protein